MKVSLSENFRPTWRKTYWSASFQ